MTRETSAQYRHRPLVVTIKPRYIEIHEKRRRDVLAMDYATIYEMALKIRWRQEKAERRDK